MQLKKNKLGAAKNIRFVSVAAKEAPFNYTEAFKSLRTNLNFLTNTSGVRSILITSAVPEESKSTTAINLALTLASSGHSVVLVEADGSKHLPLKAHLEHEPVIPACANQVIQVVGISGIGCPIEQVVHRPERFAQLCGASVTDIATLERVSTVLNTEALADRYVLNQADDEEERKWGLSLSFLLKKPTIKY